MGRTAAAKADEKAPAEELRAKEAPKKAKKPPTLSSALSGAIAGSLISACVQPLDVVRTKMQADAAKGVSRSMLATAAAIMSHQGLRGLWAGTGPSVIRVGLGAGLHFVLLEQVRSLLATHKEDGTTQLSNVGAAMAGGLSRAVAAILLCPVTVVKTRMEYVGDAATATASTSGGAAAAGGAGGAAGGAAGAAARGAAAGAGAGPASAAAGAGAAGAAARAAGASGAAGAAGAAGAVGAAGAGAAGAAAAPVYRDTFHAMRTIVRTEGVRGLFRGVWPTVLANAPYSGVYYMLYTRLREAWSEEGRPQAAVNFASGVAAAMAATLITQPADVVRTRMQLGLGTAAAAGGAAAGGGGAGAWGTLAAALRQQGPAALLTGATPRLLKRTTQTALVWTLYEDLVPRITQLGIAAKAAWEERARGQGQGPAGR